MLYPSPQINLNGIHYIGLHWGFEQGFITLILFYWVLLSVLVTALHRLIAIIHR